MRPARDTRHADAAFGEVHLAADQRPVVGETLAAVVAGEHDQRVVAQATRIERIEHAADAFVHLADHLVVDMDRAAIQVRQRGTGDLRHRATVPRLPRPMRRVVVQAEQEWRVVRRACLQVVDRAVAQQVGQVLPGVIDRLPVLVQIHLALPVEVTEITDTARQRTEVMVVPAFQRAEVRRITEVPLSDQRGAIPGRAQQRRQRWMVRLQSDRGAAA